MRKLNIFILLYPLLISGLFAQTDSLKHNVLYLTDSLLKQSPSIGNNSKIWKYKSGDNINWSSPQYSDSNWTKAQLTNQDSVVWYRLLKVRME